MAADKKDTSATEQSPTHAPATPPYPHYNGPAPPYDPDRWVNEQHSRHSIDVGSLFGNDDFAGFANANLDGGDVLDNFDFDSFLNTDYDGLGSDFPNSDGALAAGGDRMGRRWN